ncbi:hypothetical protein Xvie_04003 [Xenorhabdus vietnamensis]|uniref:Uncharacterized protein n=1 Tax=Xenorhabdus vietnamensis TaxID=351656 RepID=A0A1Y2S887_9GAMM|nr:hypothetical protein [Xenorhabdus vietnamensis]OTA14102.1 hypothetical protein Xvie_04003 [Xenorhabdus vietnamensis]
MKTQMQLAQEAIARLKSMSRQELLSELVTAGIAEEKSPCNQRSNEDGAVTHII